MDDRIKQINMRLRGEVEQTCDTSNNNFARPALIIYVNQKGKQ